jgi:rubrerythrin
MGTTLTTTEWTEIRKIATSLAGGKAVTEDNVMSAVFNHIGMERYNSMVALSGEHQARRGMKTATAKTTPKDKSAGGTRRFSELSEGEKAHAIGRMSPQQFAKYYKDTYGRDLNE